MRRAGERETDRQTERKREADRQKERETDRRRERLIETDRARERETVIETDRDRDCEIYRSKYSHFAPPQSDKSCPQVATNLQGLLV